MDSVRVPAEPHSRRKTSGFTLLELMIVTAIICILGAFAIVAYQDSVRKNRRSVAMGCLMEQAQYMERFYADNMSYLLNRAGDGPDIIGCSQDVNAFYTMTFDDDPAMTARTFSILSTPRGAQVDDECGVLGITHTGAKTAAEDDCW